MRPQQLKKTHSNDLFKSRLDQIINMKHPLVLLADKIDWNWIDRKLVDLYKEKGRPALPTRFMIGLLILKEVENLSDERVCEHWISNPYFQYFTGEEFFQHEFPHDRSDLTRWRNRIGDRLEILLEESLRIAHETGALRLSDLERVTVDTTVMEKNITHPTETKLMSTAAKKLVELSKEHGVKLRQTYTRKIKEAAIKAGRYAHAKQWKRHNNQVKFIRTRLGRIIRDIRRKIQGNDALEQAFAWVLTRADAIRHQKKGQKGQKIYSWHEVFIDCIGKGKVKKPYEFGCKVSVVTTNKRSKGGQFVLCSEALHGNPYDGHTLEKTLETVQRITGKKPKRIYADKGYRQSLDPILRMRTYLSGQKRGVHGQIKKELKRRSAIEPVIGHMKDDGRMGRNYLKGKLGDIISAIMGGVGYNFRLLIKWLKVFYLFLLWSLLPIKPKTL